MYGIATKKAKTKVEGMNKEKIKELIIRTLEGVDSSPRSNTDDIDANKSYSGGADYGSEVSATSKEDSVEQGETAPLHYSLEEGHGLDQGDIDILQKFVDGKDMDVIPLKRVLKFIIKSNILQDKTKDLSKGKVDERVTFDDVLDLRADKADLEDRISQLYRDMEQEAEPEGGEVADRYGSELEKLEAKLYRVMKQINDYDMNEGTDNEKEIKGQELVDYIMSNWNWSEEKTLNWLADNYGKGKQDDGPKEEDQRYIDYLRRSGRDEYADKLVAKNPTTLKEETFEDFIDKHQLLHVAIEQTIYVQNFQTAQILGAARGAAIAVASMRGLPVFEYAPLRIKQAVAGAGRASKEQVARTICSITGTDLIDRLDESDAAAVALCHAYTWRGE